MFIERAGGSVKGEISTGSVPAGLEPVYVHQSRILSEIVVELLCASASALARGRGQRRASHSECQYPMQQVRVGEAIVPSG